MNPLIIDKHIDELLLQLDFEYKTLKLDESNVFIPTLILLALYPAKEHLIVEKIANRILQHILKNRSAGWTWNYWPRNSSVAKQYPYPDDLDDTSCAISVIAQWKPELINGNALASITKTLMEAECRPGGPYFTWIIPRKDMTEEDTAFRECIDLAVNANTANMLSAFNVYLPELTEYIDREIRAGLFHSHYYHNPLVTIYFITKNYRGNEKSLLIEQIKGILEKTDANEGSATELDFALAICSLIRLGVNTDIVDSLIKKLLSHSEHQAQSVYIERTSNGTKHYARSKMLTISIALEACILYRNMPKNLSVTSTQTAMGSIQKKIVEKIEVHRQDLPRETWQTLDRTIKEYKSSPLWDEITTLPYSLVQTNIIDPRVQNIAVLTGTVSLIGWIAYTIDDEIMDNDITTGNTRIQSADLVPLSRYLHRLMFDMIENEIIPIAQPCDQDELRCYIRKILNMTDNAHCLETVGRKVPMARKSFCHALPSMIAMKVYMSILESEPEQGLQDTREKALNLLQGSLHHYICARQLSDDAHDWEEDTRLGRITNVTERVHAASDKNDTDCIDREIASEILNHAVMARGLAMKSQFIFPSFNIDFLVQCITRYETTATKIIVAVDRKQEFIFSYNDADGGVAPFDPSTPQVPDEHESHVPPQ